MPTNEHHMVIRDLAVDPGSFRDRSNRVYTDSSRIYRGVNSELLEKLRQFLDLPLFKDLVAEKKLVATRLLVDPPDSGSGDWAGYLEHERIPFISYPYEWCFSMLKDAALLQLELIDRAIPVGWTHKDASAYNVQWIGARPIFIDLPSFDAYTAGEPWVGYRQYCMMYLYPLMLRAYRDLPFQPLLRSNLEGIEPDIANKMLSGLTRFRKGVLGHVFLHATMQRRHQRAEVREARALTENADIEPKQKPRTKHSMAMVLGTLDGLRRVVRKLRVPERSTVWGDYDTGHSYAASSLEIKKAFVDKHAGSKRRRLVWDLGCNTGTFSKICSKHSEYVVAADGDEEAIERLYQRLKQSGPDNILPLVLNLANISPGQGWRGQERKSFDAREKPQLVLCLALIHHIVISANIPLREFLGWLRDLRSEVIIELVGLEDDMVKMMLRNRVNQYDELSEARFEQALRENFEIADTQALKGGHRKLYYLKPR